MTIYWDAICYALLGGFLIGAAVNNLKNNRYWLGGVFAMLSIHYIVMIVICALERL